MDFSIGVVNESAENHEEIVGVMTGNILVQLLEKLFEIYKPRKPILDLFFSNFLKEMGRFNGKILVQYLVEMSKDFLVYRISARTTEVSSEKISRNLI